MKIRSFFFAFFLITLIVSLNQAQDARFPNSFDPPQFQRPLLLVERQEATQIREAPRRNIGLFFDKVRSGKTLSIAYLGGSVSQGIGASDANKTSYRALVNAWLKNHFPQTKFNELNAAAPSTNSLYAAIRVRRDVVEQKPDLVFLEFAASDAEENSDAVEKSIEGIIRQLLAVSQPPEIVMVYAPNAKNNATISSHEKIANYYHLPALNLVEMLKNQSVNLAIVSKDGINLNDDGHKFIADKICEFLAAEENAKASPPVRVLPGYYLSDEMTYGELKPFAEIAHGPLWHNENSIEKTLPSALLVGDKANQEINVSFEGTVVGLSFRSGPDSGVIECLIDGKPAPAPLKHIDLYSKEPTIGTRIIAGGLSYGEHKLTIKIKAEKNPKSAGMIVRLGAFLIGGSRPERL